MLQEKYAKLLLTQGLKHCATLAILNNKIVKIDILQVGCQYIVGMIKISQKYGLYVKAHSNYKWNCWNPDIYKIRLINLK